MPFKLNTSRLIGLGLTLWLLVMTWIFWDNSRREKQLQMEQAFQHSSQIMVGQVVHRFLHLQTLTQQLQSLHAATQDPSMGPLRQFLRTQLQYEELPDAVRVAILAPADARLPLPVGSGLGSAAGPGVQLARVLFVEPATVLADGGLGNDPFGNPAMAKALRDSAASGQLTVTDGMALAGADSAAAKRVYALVGPLVAAPRPGGKGPAVPALQGWISTAFDPAALTGALPAELAQQIGLDVYASSPPRAETLVYRSDAQTAPVASLADAPGPNPLRLEKAFALGGKQWILVASPRSAFFELASTRQADWMAWLGVLASLLIGGMVWVLSGSRERAMRMVQQYTQDLQRSHADLKAVLDALPDLLFELDLEGRYHGWWSPRRDLLAAPPEAFMGKHIAEVLPPQACATCLEVLQECMRSGYSSGRQIQLEINNETKWFELSAARKNAASDTPRFIMLSRDITERKRAETAIIERTHQLDLALQGGDMGFWEWDFPSGQINVNDRWYSMLGLSPGSLQPTLAVWEELLHPADRAKFRQLVDTVIRQREGVEFALELRVRHALGHYVWVREKGAVFSRDPQGQPLRIVGTHMDITPNKRFEEKLRLNEYAFQSVTQGICITDLEGSVIAVNDAMCHITGYSREELLGNNCRMFQGPGTDPAMIANIREALHTKTIFENEILNFRKDGHPFWNDLVIAPVLGAESEITHFVGVTKDVTEKKKTDLIIAVERNAIRMTTEQLRVLSRRLLEAQETERRRVAHELHDELGQSLTAIKINLLTDQGRRGTPPNAVERENVRIVEDAIQQVRRIALALRPSMLDDLGLESALAWLAKSASVGRDIQIDFHCNMDQSRLPSNVETACFRIVQEALTNVRRHAHATQVSVYMDVLQGQLKLEITDNGVGTKGHQSEGGLAAPSLGLLGMRERASSIGGTITIHSVPNQGTTVELLCSLPEPEPEPEPSTA